MRDNVIDSLLVGARYTGTTIAMNPLRWLYGRFAVCTCSLTYSVGRGCECPRCRGGGWGRVWVLKLS